jgi:hypothetical protein
VKNQTPAKQHYRLSRCQFSQWNIDQMKLWWRYLSRALTRKRFQILEHAWKIGGNQPTSWNSRIHVLPMDPHVVA